jgi:hypothetical protein
MSFLRWPRAPVIQALVNHTPIKDPDLYTVMGLPGMDPNAAAQQQKAAVLV